VKISVEGKGIQLHLTIPEASILTRILSLDALILSKKEKGTLNPKLLAERLDLLVSYFDSLPPQPVTPSG